MRCGSALSLLGLLALAANVSADELPIASWQELQAADRLPSGELVDRDGPHEFVLKLSSATGASWTVAEINGPGITASRYELAGQVRYESVSQPGYLEMWSVFPDGSRYFSRTLADIGPMRSLSGTAAWRDFSLPFSVSGAPDETRPVKLEVNVVLPGGGTVYLSKLRLTQGAGMAWWSDRSGGWIGGVLGSVLGVIGALIGGLSSFRRARSVVLGLLGGCVAIGAVLVVIGLIALLSRQPYGVWYPLLLVGVIALAVCGGLLPVACRRFEMLELQRMQALDSAGAAFAETSKRGS